MYDLPDGTVMIVAHEVRGPGSPGLPRVFTYESEVASYGDWMLD